MALLVVVPGPGRPGPGLDPAQPATARVDPARRVAASLASSVRAVRGHVPATREIAVLDFADLFNRATPGGAEGRSAAAAQELADGFLRGWLRTADQIGQRGNGAQRDLDALTALELNLALADTAHFREAAEAPITEALALGRYLTDRKLRHEARDRTQSAITPECRVVVGHGLGALIAYEALCALGDAVSVTLVTLSAALCGPEPVFERLEPPPRDAQGHWPAAVHRWFNVVAHGDPTAMTAPFLTQRFGPGIEDEVIEIRSVSGELYSYLLDRVTGRAVATGLG